MKISDVKVISMFLNKLDHFPDCKSNREALNDFVTNLLHKLSLSFGSSHYLTKAVNKIKFTPKSYFLETEEIDKKNAWETGIKVLKEALVEIIEESHKVLDMSDLFTLESIISSGVETNYIEFKSSLRWDLNLQQVNTELEKVVLKTVCALNNSEGGNLFIGVADNGNILGLEDDYKTLNNGSGDRDKFELHLRNLLNNAYSRSFVAKNIEVLFPKPSNIEICQIKVMKGSQPLFLRAGKGQDTKDKFYIRNGNQSVELEKVPELVDYALKRFV